MHAAPAARGSNGRESGRASRFGPGALICHGAGDMAALEADVQRRLASAGA